jgi:hypothetical protein
LLQDDLNFSKSAELPEPAQRQPHLGSFQLVTTDKSLNAHALDASALERSLSSALQ